MAGALAVVGLVGGAIVVRAGGIGGDSPVGSATATGLEAAADRLDSRVDPLAPGQYRQITTRSWARIATPAGAGGVLAPRGRREFVYLAETQTRTWAPYTWTDEWLMRTEQTGRRKWIRGSEAGAREVGLPIDRRPPEVSRARCGDFGRYPGQRECTQTGRWQSPTPEWLAGLPRHPKRLFQRLRGDTPGSRGDAPWPVDTHGDAELLTYAADGLRTGLLPTDLQAALYRALALLPGLRIVDRAAGLDGRVGVAYGMDDGSTRHDIVLDERTGQFIGERKVATDDADLPRGTVLSYTSVATTVVDHIAGR